MTAVPGSPQWLELEKTGMAVLDDFMTAFNACDENAWAKTLHFPHARLAGGRLQIWGTPEEYIRDSQLARLREIAGWAYSAWDWRNMVQAGEDKLHIAVQFSRYTAEHKKIVSYESFYILTRENDRWGVKFRSSYAGVITGNTAF